jgi:hypothetical protein
MSPAYLYDNTTAVTDIQWISPTESYSSQRLTRIDDTSTSQSYYRQEYVYEPPPKPETRKERVTRQSTAFSMFYGKRQYLPKKISKSAQQKEVIKRENKFKGLNRNLYEKSSVIS